MSESSSIARPYAQAVFELAKETGNFEHWSENLQNLSQIVSLPDMQALLSDPRVARDQVLNLVLKIGETQFDEKVQNLIRILSHYRRLLSVPQICELYESLRAQEQGIIEAELETAYEVDDDQLSQLIDAMQNKLGRKVRLTRKVNADLIGGVVIRAGDWVVDDSIRARLGKLSSSLGV